MIDYRYSKSASEVAEQLTHHIRGLYDASEHRPFSIAISGGSTVGSLLELWREQPQLIRGMELLICWVDERMVSVESEMSNFGNAYRAFFGTGEAGVEVCPISYSPAVPTEESAARYEARLRQQLSASGAEWLDLVILGMGDDGHTSSLFPGVVYPDDGRLYVEATHPSDGTERVALSYAGIAKASNVVLHLLGDGKREMLGCVLQEAKGEASLPAALALQVAPQPVVVFSDIELRGSRD